MSALQVTRAFENLPGFQAAIEAAQLGTLRMREVQRKPVAIMQLLPRWFRRMSEEGQLWKPIGGDMPDAFTAEPEDEDDEEYMEGAQEERPPARVVPVWCGCGG